MIKIRSGKRYFIASFEWSESPYHEGQFYVYLSFNKKKKIWSLSSKFNPSEQKLSWKRGEATDDMETVAFELLRRSYERGALMFDLISDEGPFNLTLKNLRSPEDD